jgi:hypothetical protein
MARLSHRRMIWFLPPPPPTSPVSKLYRRKTETERQLADRGGAESNDGEKAWSSINPSILSEMVYSYLNRKPELGLAEGGGVVILVRHHNAHRPSAREPGKT